MLKRQCRAVALVLVLALALGSVAETAAQPLNSERIAQVFGSYGIDVMINDENLRISSLYSTDDGTRTTRTLAIVAWLRAAEPDLAEAHAAILAGASIGATLEAAGWAVGKRNLYFGETPVPEDVSRYMRIAAGTALATHGYVLSASQGDQRIDYARIAEIHHPDYLDRAMLEAIYGSIEPADRDQGAAVLELIRGGLGRLARLASEGSE